MFRLPSLGLAEIAWRWSFGLAVVVLLAFSFREYLATLPVTAGDLLLLRTRQPALVWQAIARIFQGSAPRAIAAAIVLILTLTLASIALSAIGRAATLKRLFEYFREREADTVSKWHKANWRLSPLVGLNFLRAGAMLTAGVGCFGALLLAGAASSPNDPSPGSVLLIFWMLTMLIGLAWSVLNWFLSVAAIFAVNDGSSTLGALGATADLFRAHPGPVTAAATWFGLAHVVIFVVASSVAAFPLAFAGVLPAGIVLGGLVLITLLYFAIVDFLHVGRLAAYVCMTIPESTQPSALSIQLFPPSEDDILSDIPGALPPPEATGG